MRTTIAAVFLGIVALGLSGCEKAAPPKVAGGGVVVVDVERVVKAMGWLDDLQKTLQQSEGELRGQLEELRKTRLKAIDDKKADLIAEAKLTADQAKHLRAANNLRELDGLPLSSDQKQSLADLAGRANTEMARAQEQYNQALQGRQNALLASYRDKISPVAGRVAVAQGASVVLTPVANVLYFDPKTVDITDKVIEELQRITPTTQPSR